MGGFSIGELSGRTDVNIEAIRYYERIGIMPDPGRTSGGNRQYDCEHLKRLTFIRKCRALGFGIEEIRKLLKLVDRKNVSCGQVHQLAVNHLGVIREKLSGLQRLEQVLSTMVEECGGAEDPQCPIIDTLFETDDSVLQVLNYSRLHFTLL